MTHGHDAELHDASGSLTRRRLMQLTGATAAAAATLTGAPALAQYVGTWDKTFPRSTGVDHSKVAYTNRLGIRLVADLYVPRSAERDRRRRAIIVGHPYGGVKEQTSGLYAQTLAERGFVTLAHDASYNGESGGQPHFICSPEAFVEDFSAGVDFLGVNPLVDRTKIGVLGVCASGGFSLAAAQIDPRIKAVATVSMYDMGSAMREGLNRTISDTDRRKALRDVGEQRWVEAAGGAVQYGALPETLTPDTDPATREFFAYYRTPRGRHPRATTAMAVNGNATLAQFRPFDHVDTISPRPVLLVAGENAHSLYFSEEAFAKAAQPKELHIVRGAGHVDLYDRTNLIPFGKLADFFNRSL